MLYKSFKTFISDKQLESLGTNLQPLWKELNLAKRDMIVDEDWYLQRGVVRKLTNGEV
jgi:hypothetical protein